MKKLLIPVFFFVTAHSTYSVAQERGQEKIIIQEENNQDGDTKKVVIEIKDGQLFIDKKKITGDINKKNLLIIKEFKNALTNSDSDIEIELDGPLEFNWDRSGTGNKAVLGVMTEQTDNNNGVLVKEVLPGSAAEKAGIEKGDLITKVGNKIITSPQDLVNAISGYKGGEEVTMEIVHNDKPQEQKVVLQSKPDDMGSGLMRGDDFFKGLERLQGLERLEDMFKSFKGFNSDNFNFRFFDSDNIPSASAPKIGVQVEDRADGEGVRVLSVTKGEPMDQAGIKIDDVITEFNGISIGSVDDLTRALKNASSNNEIKFTAKRNGKAQQFKLKMPIILKKKDF